MTYHGLVSDDYEPGFYVLDMEEEGEVDWTLGGGPAKKRAGRAQQPGAGGREAQGKRLKLWLLKDFLPEAAQVQRLHAFTCIISWPLPHLSNVWLTTFSRFAGAGRTSCACTCMWGRAPHQATSRVRRRPPPQLDVGHASALLPLSMSPSPSPRAPRHERHERALEHD